LNTLERPSCGFARDLRLQVTEIIDSGALFASICSIDLQSGLRN
jgi:hypothetical protein